MRLSGFLSRPSIIVCSLGLILCPRAWASWSIDPTANTGVCAEASNQGGPLIAGVGAGGYIVAWSDDRFPSGIYAQRLALDGTPQWTADGKQITSAPAQPQGPTGIVSDGAGGAILAWIDVRSGAGHIYCERIDAAGTPQWGGGNGIAVTAAPAIPGVPMTGSDGAGGAILVWRDTRGAAPGIYAARVTSAGAKPWTANGVLVRGGSDLPGGIAAAGGEVVVAWLEGPIIRAQRLNSGGVLQWPAAGAPVTSTIGGDLGIVSDGAGGVIVGYSGGPDIFAQRVNSAGTALWGPNGRTLCSDPSDQLYPQVCSDGAGGAIVIWHDYRNLPLQFYGRRVNSGGVVQWAADGVPLTVDPEGIAGSSGLTIVADGFGGVIAVWSDDRNPPGILPDLYGQRLNSSGARLWLPDGSVITAAPSAQLAEQLAATPEGGVVAVWQDQRVGPTNWDIYAQRVLPGGQFVDPGTPTVSFSVNGPVDPHTEGIRDARGAAPSLQVPAEPGNTIAFGIRSGPVPQAAGLATARPGDVSDYVTASLPSEAIVFQSPPISGPVGPDGTNNQIIEAKGSGLVRGPAVATSLWTSLPPDAPARDNIDALSFGSDYFPPVITVGLDPASALPDPPTESPIPWDLRGDLYKEPVVLTDGAGLTFYFSVDPWAIGAPGTAVRTESGGADAGAGLGPWSSAGKAAGDVFETARLKRVAGATVGIAGNALAFDNPALALAPNPGPMTPMEDDLDALECVGENNAWLYGWSLAAGNVHARVADVGPDLPAPGVSNHEPVNYMPVFFSVTRNSTGAPGSAVRSQFVNDGGAAADIFVMVKDPAAPAGEGTNLLFIDEAELGLLAIDNTPGSSGPDDYTDDLDGLILSVCPEFRQTVISTIQNLMATRPWVDDPATGARTGTGMTYSLTKSLGGSIPPGCIRVGFSVSTDAVGWAYTGVDWEAGPVAPAGGVASAAGDVFYAEITGGGHNRNYLWYEETSLGLHPGAWVNGVSMNLADVCDNVDALDSDSTSTVLVGVNPTLSDGPGAMIALAPPAPNPFGSRARVSFRTHQHGIVRVAVFDVTGRRLVTLVDTYLPAGSHSVSWQGTDAAGHREPAGLYFVRASLNGQVSEQRLVMLESSH